MGAEDANKLQRKEFGSGIHELLEGAITDAQATCFLQIKGIRLKASVALSLFHGHLRTHSSPA
jgi:hypothetical protein